ncbi:Uncharacterised protein [Burkholderia pseudomallei]|nr:Uncharacterised protein [Burkholderia pseudomallei]
MRQVEFLAGRGRIARDVRDRRRHVVDGAQALAKLAQLGNRAQRDARLHEPPPPLVVGAQAGLRVIRRVADAKRDKRQPARARRVGELLHHPFALHVADVGAHGVEILVEVVVLAHHGLARDPVPPAIDRDRRQQRQRLHARGGGEPDHVDEPVDVVALHRRIRLDEVDRARRMMDDVDAPAERVVIRARHAEPVVRDVPGVAPDARAIALGHAEPVGAQFVGDPPLGVVRVPRPHDAMDHRLRGGQQLREQMHADEARRARQQHVRRAREPLRIERAVERDVIRQDRIAAQHVGGRQVEGARIAGRRPSPDVDRERRGGRPPVQIGQTQRDADPRGQRRDGGRRDERMAAHVEEAVVDAEIRMAERVGERFAHRALDGVGHLREIRARGAPPVHRDERRLVGLAVRGQRQRVDDREMAGYHERRQRCGHARAQAADERPARRGRIGRHDERDEFSRRAVGGRRRDDGDPAHARLPRDRDLDLTRLDEIAADLHLIVEATDELDRAVGQPAPEVARPIDALAGARRMRKELLRGLPRIVEIAARETRARDDNLADGTALRLAQSLVEYRDSRAADRRADRRRQAEARALHRMKARPHRRLGRPVVVDQPITDAVRVDRIQLLAAGEQIAQLRRARFARGHDVARHHRRHERMRDPLALEQRDERVRVAPRVVVDEAQPRARAKRRPDLPMRGVEAERGDLRRATRAVDAELRVVPRDQPVDRAMLDDDALGHTRRTRGEDHVDRVVRPRRARRRRTRHPRAPQRRDARGARRPRARERRARRHGREQQRRAGSLDDVRLARFGIRVIDRAVRGARLHDAEHARDEIVRAHRLDRHDAARTDALGLEKRGDGVARAVELAIRHRRIRGRDGNGPRRGGAPRAHPFEHGVRIAHDILLRACSRQVPATRRSTARAVRARPARRGARNRRVGYPARAATRACAADARRRHDGARYRADERRAGPVGACDTGDRLATPLLVRCHERQSHRFRH